MNELPNRRKGRVLKPIPKRWKPVRFRIGSQPSFQSLFRHHRDRAELHPKEEATHKQRFASFAK